MPTGHIPHETFALSATASSAGVVRTLVIGCGNLLCGDDAAGPVLVRRLQQRRLRSDVECVDGGTAGIDAALQMRGRDHVILVDACRGAGEPGAIVEVSAADLERLPPPAGVSLHSLRWDHVVACGRRLLGDDAPRSLTAFLIEAESCEPGADLSPAVARAVDELEHLLAARLEPSAAEPGRPAAAR